MTRTHEEIVGVGNVAANAEEFHQVMKLSVNVTAYLMRMSLVKRACAGLGGAMPYRDRSRNCHHITLLDQELSGLVA